MSECNFEILNIYSYNNYENIQFNCVEEGDNKYKCDLGNQKESKGTIQLILDFDYDINFYQNLSESYIKLIL